MRFYKNLFILVAVLALLVTAYIFIPKSDNGNAETKKITVKELDKAKVTSVELKNEKGTFALEKSGNEWVMVKPQDYTLDTVSTNSFIDSMTKIEAVENVEENVQDMERFGLKNPAATVTIKSTDGKSTVLELGDKTPIDESYYLRLLGSNTVYKVNSTTAGEFLMGLTEFRNKSIFNFKKEDAVEFVLKKQGKETLKFIKDSDWKVDLSGKLNQGIQANIITAVSEVAILKVTEYIEDNAKADLAKYGLDNPQYIIGIKLKDGSKLELLLGNESDTGIYAKVGTGTEVFTITKADLGFLDKEAKEYVENK